MCSGDALLKQHKVALIEWKTADEQLTQLAKQIQG